MTKIDIISGFLGAGKTTFIKKMIEEAFVGEKLVLIENEFGEVGIDGGFLKDSGIEITEMNSGCICCSLVGDFGKNLNEVITKFHPDRILIEPSGVGKLSDVMKSVIDVEKEQDVKLNALVTVVNAKKASKQMKAFGEFFNNQIEFATTIVLSRTQSTTPEQLELCVKQMQELNGKAAIITTPWDAIKGEQILKVMEGQDSLEMKLLAEAHHKAEEEEHEHHHDHDHEGGEVEEYGIGTFVYYRRKAFDLGLFDEFVARKWPRDIVRAKGICYFADEPDMCYVFEQAGQQKTVKQAGQWLATMPADQLAELRKNNPQLEKEWDEKLGDRMIKIVFIGQHIKDQKDAIIAELDKTLAL